MFESVQGLLDEHDAIQAQLGDPAVYADQRLARKLGRRSAQLNGIVEAYHKWEAIQDDLAAAKEMADEDPEFAAEVPELEAALEVAAAKLRRLLIPRDPDDARNVILEVKGGEGGDEAALFAADLLRMYSRYAETRGWKTEIISATESDLGGYKDVQMAVKGNSNDPAEGVFARLKFEGGVHRVQRVPVTESQGRIHTSAAGVLVLPEVDEPEELEINQNDLKIDV
ncbi:MAG: peptide chain release factor 1 [Pseudarthrobacter sp.]|nr:peptide chain release factor 1 [Pseudarthrobacter sp.]